MQSGVDRLRALIHRGGDRATDSFEAREAVPASRAPAAIFEAGRRFARFVGPAHRTWIIEKLDIREAAILVRYAIRRGPIQP